MRAIFASALLTLSVAGCADPEPAQDRQPGGVAAGERQTGAEPSPTARAVTIGEGGARFGACQGRGRVGGLRGDTLPVREAPFDTAKQVGALADDAQVFVCTRSLDQQWLGIVVAQTLPVAPAPVAPAPDAAPAAVDAPAAPATAVDCGVTRPVRAKRAYSGPCLSGWVESTFVAAVAG